jgi:hypothetical protein
MQRRLALLLLEPIIHLAVHLRVTIHHTSTPPHRGSCTIAIILPSIGVVNDVFVCKCEISAATNPFAIWNGVCGIALVDLRLLLDVSDWRDYDTMLQKC